MRDKMIALISRHCVTIVNEAAEIDAAMADLERNTECAGSELVAQVHKLKGSSGSIGFVEISEHCREMEEILRRSQGKRKTEVEMTEIRSRHQKLRECMGKVKPEDSTLYQRFA